MNDREFLEQLEAEEKPARKLFAIRERDAETATATMIAMGERLEGAAELAALLPDDPAMLRTMVTIASKRVQDLEAERDAARSRVAELEKALEEKAS